MATAADYLTTARDNAARRLSELDTVPVDQRARFTHTTSQGVAYDWNGYRQALVNEIEKLQVLIQQVGGPFTVIE